MQRCSVLDCMPILYYLIIVGFNTYSFHSSWRSQDWSPRGLGGRHPGVSPGPCPSSLEPRLAPAQVMVTTASYRPHHDHDGCCPAPAPAPVRLRCPRCCGAEAAGAEPCQWPPCHAAAAAQVMPAGARFWWILRTLIGQRPSSN